MAHTQRWERMAVAKGIEKGPNGVARDKKHSKGMGVIYGYAVMRKGLVKDCRGWEIDDKTLNDLVAFGNGSKIGIKSRFGHPEMSSTAFGTFLGRAKNFRRDKDIVRADLYLDDSAYKTPKGDLASYVLDIAESDPDAFGTSVVMGGLELEYRLEKDGTPKKDKDGKELPPLLRFKALRASDVVDEGAATDGMFEYEEGVQFSAEASALLDKFFKVPDAEEKIYGFLDRYFSNHIPGDDGEAASPEASHATDQENNKTEKEEEQRMDAVILKEVTLSQLKSGNPALFESIYNEALGVGKEQGIKEERERASAILKKSKDFPENMFDIAFSCVESGDAANEALIKMQEKQLKALQENRAGNDVGPDDDPDAADAPELKNQPADQAHVKKAMAYQREHKCSMTDALRATAPKRQ